MKDTKQPKWVCTDSDTKQYGRQHTEFIFEFKEQGKEQTAIDLTGFTNGQIEGVINSYGYTQFETKNGLTNIKELYNKDANWIIAECLFEMDM